MKAFVDTSLFVALVLKRDQWHRRARRALKPRPDLYTSSAVINETVSLLQQRGYFSAALEFLRSVRQDGDMRIIHADPVLQTRAWDGYAQWGASGANAVDCLSFAVMRELGIRRALTFDQHFRSAGFEISS